jgi:hypothetical protein
MTMRWVALFFATMLPNLGLAQDLESIKVEAAACRQYIADIGLDWPIAPWDCREEPAVSLSQALQYDLEFSGGRAPVGQNTPACDPLIDAGFPTCDYNVRITLAQFLSMYGVELFPSRTRPHGQSGPGDTAYYGTGDQNAVLMGAIKRNAALFADGDLTAAEVALWR